MILLQQDYDKLQFNMKILIEIISVPIFKMIGASIDL